ncbi:hypothetical protein KGO5_02277 [Sinorhizobium sp. KGO-5]|nr:hypothetical protein KGO5_02277 [Sinorhizobium sp. KGO-5]
MSGRPYHLQATIVAKEAAQLFESLYAHLNPIWATLRMRGVTKQEQSVATYWHAS